MFDGVVMQINSGGNPGFLFFGVLVVLLLPLFAEELTFEDSGFSPFIGSVVTV